MVDLVAGAPCAKPAKSKRPTVVFFEALGFVPSKNNKILLYSSITGLHLGQYFQNLPITENEKMKKSPVQNLRHRQAIKRNLIDLAHAAIIALLIGLPFAGYFAFVMGA